MFTFRAISAIDSDWGIGNKGKLLFHIKEDLKQFKELTKNRIVIMGKNTYLSLPNQHLLTDRLNIILSSSLEKEIIENKNITVSKVPFHNSSDEEIDEKNCVYELRDLDLSRNANGYLCKDILSIQKILKNIWIFQYLLNMKFLSDEVWIIGGESIYKLFLPYCLSAIITKVDKKYEADRYFPNLENNTDWKLSSTSQMGTTEDGIEYLKCEYDNLSPKNFFNETF